MFLKLNLLFLLLKTIYSLQIINSAYHNVVVQINDHIDRSECYNVLNNLVLSLSNASQFLFNSLDGRAYFGSIIIIYPTSWPDSCVPNNETTITASGEKVDIELTKKHEIYGNQIWTKQYGGCGVQGEKIFMSYGSMERETVKKEIVREWAKYRYGVFDEIGYENDEIYPKCYQNDRKMMITGCMDLPLIDEIGFCNDNTHTITHNATVNQLSRKSILYSSESPSITMFCDEGTHNRYAPTKHNFFCNHQSVLDVILQHKDFQIKNMMKIQEPSAIVNTSPTFIYKKRKLTRYILVIDETQDMLVRESWSFLRNAIRKWVVYDLTDNTEIGIVMVKGDDTLNNLDIISLNVEKNRDTIASYFPFSPSETRQQACIECGLKKAVEMLNSYITQNGPSNSIILVIAPGMSYNTNFKNISKICLETKIKITTINYPGIVRRQTLDSLAEVTGGSSYTIYENKQNIEKTFLSTYFELTNILYHIGYENYEGNKLDLPLEIHRKELFGNIDETTNSLTKQNTRNISGSFFFDNSLSSPSGFFIYTHNTEQPLIEGLKLISPAGKVFSTRSDLRLYLKQITISAVINETGSWTYSMLRILGNPQSHYVQVLATPLKHKNNAIKAQSWIKILHDGTTIIYTQCFKGDLPILSADVEVTVIRSYDEKLCGNNIDDISDCYDKFILFDNGAGDPDIMEGDGIYSRYFKPEFSGVYRFEIIVTDKRNTAYTIGTSSFGDDYQKCCGSKIPTPTKQTLSSFQRYLPPHTLYLTTNQSKTAKYNNNKTYGKIGDLRGELVNKTKIRLTWTSPDMGGYNVARYEIKYSKKIIDIVDNYDTGALYWNYDQPFVYSIGDPTTFTLNLSNDIASFSNQFIYIAIRGYSHLTRDAVVGPTSNWIEIYIPPKNKVLYKNTNSKDLQLPSEIALNIDLYNNNSESSFDIGINSNRSYPYLPNFNKNLNQIGLIVIISLIVLILLFLVIIFCIFFIKKREKLSDKLKNECQSQMQHHHHHHHHQQLHIDTAQMKCDELDAIKHNENELIYDDEYNNLDTIIDSQIHHNHQTIGLPQIYTTGITQSQHPIVPSTDYSYDFKKYSYINPNDQQLIDDLKLHNNTPRILSPYESWTASQLLHEHEKRISPIMLDDCNISITTTNNGLQVGNNIINNNNHQQPQQHNRTPPPPIPPLPFISNIIHPIQNGLPYNNPSLQGSICSVNSNDNSHNKKRRNVTMV